MQREKREKEIYRVTVAGSIVNALLVVFKFIAGFAGRSAAMIADAVHSLSDFVTDIIVLIFVGIAGRPSDRTHDYGHGKYETVATAIIGVILFYAGASLCVKGVRSIYGVLNGAVIQRPGMISLWAAMISVLIKEIIYRFTAYTGRKTNSKAVIANAWHHRSDAFSSIGTVAGIAGAIFLGEKWRVLDPISAVVVSLFIIKVSYGLLRPCFDELTETSLPDDIEEEIAELVKKEPEVSGLHNLRTRRIGSRYAMEMHIRLDGGMSLSDAHSHATNIEKSLRGRFGEGTHVGIHVEPVKKAQDKAVSHSEPCR